MKFGKVSEAIYRRSIWNGLKQCDWEVCQGMEIGVDACVHAPSGGICPVTSASTVTELRERGGKIALNRAVNHLAAMGAVGKSAWVSFLLPDWFMESHLKASTEELNDTAKELGIGISGVCAEGVPGLKKPVVTASAYGEALPEEWVTPKRITVGMDIVMTKEAGTEGGIILAFEREKELLERFTPAFLDRVQGLFDRISSVKEARAAVSYGVKAMHTIGEGGVFGALWEIGEAAQVGLEVDGKKIPIRQEVIEICEVFSINPYQIPSAGSLLLAAENGYDLAEKLNQNGFDAVVIGHTLAGKDRVIVQEGERRFLEPPKMDELRKGLKEEAIGGQER